MNLNLIGQEQKIYELKHKSKPVSYMSEKELSLATNAILIKINVITGWSFPVGDTPKQTDLIQSELKNQFQKKLVESYPNVNMDEMEYAFRNYPVKDWGKNINLNLIDEVMQPYLTDRREVSKIEEAQVKELPPPIDDTPFFDDEKVSTDKFLYKTTKNLRIITQDVVKILFKEKKIVKPADDICEAIRKQAIGLLMEELREERKTLTHEAQEKEIRKIMNQILVARYFNENN